MYPREVLMLIQAIIISIINIIITGCIIISCLTSSSTYWSNPSSIVIRGGDFLIFGNCFNFLYSSDPKC